MAVRDGVAVGDGEGEADGEGAGEGEEEGEGRGDGEELWVCPCDEPESTTTPVVLADSSEGSLKGPEGLVPLSSVVPEVCP